MHLQTEKLELELDLERIGPFRRVLKAGLINPMANYLPAGLVRGLLKFGKSELAQANWSDPGGWRSMVISYDGQPRQIADRMLVNGGTISMALRNRLKIGSRILADLIDQCDASTPHVLCLGAGPGRTIIEAMRLAERPAEATLVDLSADAFEYGRELARRHGMLDRVRFVQGDVREVDSWLTRPPDLVKMLGICEYISDRQVQEMVDAVGRVMPVGGAVVVNSISRAHGTDRFFRRVLGLNMIHRSPERIEQMLAPAGFGQWTRTAEPLGVYDVLVGRKL